MARFAFLKHQAMINKIQDLNEAIAIDGLENFACSQFDPNNIHHAIGVRSLFCYDFDFTHINRKGRMSNRQKGIKAKIEEMWGSYDPKGIRHSFARVLNRLQNLRKDTIKPLRIYTDMHFQYKRALGWDLEIPRLEHDTVSSKSHRDFKNILFGVNHLDLLLRKDVKAFARETICFAKKPARMIQKYMLYVAYNNYMCPCFVKKHKRRETAHTHSPAMELGLCSKILTFSEFFDGNPKITGNELNAEWKLYRNDQVSSLRDKKFNKKAA